MHTAFVGGATGYTGREVVRDLVARRVKTIAHVRPDSPRLEELTRDLSSDGAVVDITPWEEPLVAATLSAIRPDFVFALLGTTRKRAQAARASGGPASSYESVDYALTALLLRASVACGTYPRFIYLSALGAGRASANAYYAARHKAEAEVTASGLPYLIARPAFITGADRTEPRAGERIAAAVVDGALGWMGRLGARALSDRFASMTARELASGLVELSLSASEAGLIVEPERLRAAITARPATRGKEQ